MSQLLCDFIVLDIDKKSDNNNNNELYNTFNKLKIKNHQLHNNNNMIEKENNNNIEENNNMIEKENNNNIEEYSNNIDENNNMIEKENNNNIDENNNMIEKENNNNIDENNNMIEKENNNNNNIDENNNIEEYSNNIDENNNKIKKSSKINYFYNLINNNNDNDNDNDNDNTSNDSVSYILNKSFIKLNNKSLLFDYDKKKNINGWNYEANITIINWYHTFKKKKFIYQYILDRNKNISNILHILSILLSSLLGIFTAFKLKLSIDDNKYQMISDIILMIFNFINAFITVLSKKYIDEKRNEEIRKYIIALDNFLGEIAAQVLKTLNYRIFADEFFKINNDKYTKLITTAPNISLKEMYIAKKQYKLHAKD